MATILVIDDNADIRDNTAEILELGGYKVLTAENGKKGVDLALKEIPDLIVCDIMMPELDGYGVLHLLRKNDTTQHTPFIFLTAKTERSDLRKGMEMGADDYIPKPFEDIELLNAVEVRLKKTAILNKPYATGAEGIAHFLSDARENGLVRQLSEKYAIENYPKKTIIYQEGRRPRNLYFVVNGKVKTFKTHEDGKEYITELYSSGDFFGFAPLLEDRVYDDSAVVMENSELMLIPRQDFLEMIFQDMHVAAKFIRLMTNNVREKEERLLNLAYSSLRKRVARALVDITKKFDNDRIEISREEIAQYVGTATESLIRTLSDFKSEKLVEIREGKIRIPDRQKLETLLY
jgi:CRP-like cAMP-binding protein/CheY-like chemotaxis protein